MCDDHPEVPAVARMQGETDSFGSEMHDLCQACVDQWKQQVEAAAKEEHYCEWCKTSQVGVRPYRDMEEGSCGRLYDVCPACRKKDGDYWRAEAEAHYQKHGHPDDYLDDD
jgi:hypothetical protein